MRKKRGAARETHMDEKSALRRFTNRQRRLWMRSGKKFAAIQANAVRLPLMNGRVKTFITCNCCRAVFTRDDIEADHIEPVGPLRSLAPADVEEYMARLFCAVSGIQPLCKACHRDKTKLEAKQRKERKNESIQGSHPSQTGRGGSLNEQNSSACV